MQFFYCTLPWSPDILYYRKTVIHKPERRIGDMVKRGRPFTYQSEEERPVTVSLRIPRDLAERMKRYAARYRQSVTELLLDGLKWQLEQEDPRAQSSSDMEYYDNTVLQELTKSAHLVDESIPFDEDLGVFPETKAQPASDISNYNNTVIQEKASGVKKV